MNRETAQLAKAFSSAFVADMARHPRIAKDASELRRLIREDLIREVKGVRGAPSFPNLRKLLRSQMVVGERRMRAASGMGQWVEAASSLTNAIVGATGAYFTAKTQAETTKKLAEIDLTRQQIALKGLELQAAQQRLQLAATQGSPDAASASIGGGSTGPGGVPTAVWVGGGVAVGALALWMLSKYLR